jgi:nicotinamide-nucleotide amidase
MSPLTTQECAALVVRRLTEAGQTVAVAESLTGGLVMATLVSVPGASVAVRGGVVAYATDTKVSMLGVDRDLLDRAGPVDPHVVTSMATAVRERLGADWGISTTGVAGPDTQNGKAVGTVYLGIADPDGDVHAVAPPMVAGRSRDEIREATVHAVLDLLRLRLESPVTEFGA